MLLLFHVSLIKRNLLSEKFCLSNFSVFSMLPIVFFFSFVLTDFTDAHSGHTALPDWNIFARSFWKMLDCLAPLTKINKILEIFEKIDRKQRSKLNSDLSIKFVFKIGFPKYLWHKRFLASTLIRTCFQSYLVALTLSPVSDLYDICNERFLWRNLGASAGFSFKSLRSKKIRP